jgi:CspA family cold shock protein
MVPFLQLIKIHYKFNYIIMSKGTVKFFNESKGFGFITEEGVDKDHFVHISGLVDEIREGDDVEFDLEEGKKGLNAVNVKVI